MFPSLFDDIYENKYTSQLSAKGGKSNISSLTRHLSLPEETHRNRNIYNREIPHSEVLWIPRTIVYVIIRGTLCCIPVDFNFKPKAKEGAKICLDFARFTV